MDLGRGPLLPTGACFAGLMLTLVAFRDLPLLGGLTGAVLSGAVAGLLAEEAREAARAGFAAGAAAVAALLLMAFLGPAVFLGSPLLAVPSGVLLGQAVVLGFVPGLAAAGVGRLAAAWRPPPAAPVRPEPPPPP